VQCDRWQVYRLFVGCLVAAVHGWCVLLWVPWGMHTPRNPERHMPFEAMPGVWCFLRVKPDLCVVRATDTCYYYSALVHIGFFIPSYPLFCCSPHVRVNGADANALTTSHWPCLNEPPDSTRSQSTRDGNRKQVDKTLTVSRSSLGVPTPSVATSAGHSGPRDPRSDTQIRKELINMPNAAAKSQAQWNIVSVVPPNKLSR